MSKGMLDSINNASSGLAETTKAETKKASRKAAPQKETETKAERKESSAYLKLDLRPANCPKLKDYITKQALHVSDQEGVYISASAYIQRVLIADKERTENKANKFDDIIAKLEKMDKADLKLIRQILEKF